MAIRSSFRELVGWGALGGKTRLGSKMGTRTRKARNGDRSVVVKSKKIRFKFTLARSGLQHGS